MTAPTAVGSSDLLGITVELSVKINMEKDKQHPFVIDESWQVKIIPFENVTEEEWSAVWPQKLAKSSAYNQTPLDSSPQSCHQISP